MDIQESFSIPDVSGTAHRVRLTYDFEAGGSVHRKELPIVIGVLTDLSGSSESRTMLRHRRFIDINQENFDSVFAACQPKVSIKIPWASENGADPLNILLEFSSIDDFTPGRIIENAPFLKELMEMRSALVKFRQSADQKNPQMLANPADIELFNSRMTAICGSPKQKKRLLDALSQLRKADTSGEEDAETRVISCIKEINEILSCYVDNVIHAPQFQQLEASWRGLQYLVRQSRGCPFIKIRALNITKNELAKDLERAPEFDRSRIFNKVYAEEYGTAGGEPFAVLIGNFFIGRGTNDISLLEKMASMAEVARTPFIAGVGDEMLNAIEVAADSQPSSWIKPFNTRFYKKWNDFRKLRQALHVGLVFPRVLLRAPYGSCEESGSTWEYSESPKGDDYSKLLWGNGAFAFGARLIRAFAAYGWCSNICGSETAIAVPELPLWKAGANHVRCPRNCTPEVLLGESARIELDRLGFIPITIEDKTNEAVFHSAASCAQADYLSAGKGKTSSRGLNIQLEHIFAVLRVAHYVNTIMREKRRQFYSERECRKFLNQWIADYVRDNVNANKERSWERPFKKAEFEVSSVERPWNRGAVFEIVGILQPIFHDAVGAAELVIKFQVPVI